jgi:hypothetical protein
MFNLFEIANFLARPVCLYDFAWGNTHYRFTSADRAIQFPYIDGDPENGIWYSPIPISDNGFTQGVTTQDFMVTLPRANDVVELFKLTPPSESIWLTCRRFHKDDPDEEAVVYWVGTIGNIRGVDAIKAEIIGIPLSNTIRRTGLRLCWERGCPHALYGPGCEVNKELFKTETTITALTAGGYIEWEATAEGTMDRRAIESPGGGTVLNLLGTTDRLEIGQDITLYIGCDLLAETCETIFDNLANHGGHEYLAGKSPFDGNPVF